MLPSYLLVYCGVFRYIYFCSMTVHVLLLWAKAVFFGNNLLATNSNSTY